jgi:hypothetical protein
MPSARAVAMISRDVAFDVPGAYSRSIHEGETSRSFNPTLLNLRAACPILNSQRSN